MVLRFALERILYQIFGLLIATVSNIHIGFRDRINIARVFFNRSDIDQAPRLGVGHFDHLGIGAIVRGVGMHAARRCHPRSIQQHVFLTLTPHPQ